MIEVRRYISQVGRDVFGDWLADLDDARAKSKIAVRIARVAAGNLGDVKRLRDGVFELRVDYGPGYRVYCGREGASMVVLLCGGDKRKQSADIVRAVEYWNDYKQRMAKP